MTCEGVRERLSAYIDGELSEIERRQVERHLGRCVACAEEERFLRQTVALLRSLDEGSVPPDFRAKLRARLLELPAPSRQTQAAPVPAWRRFGISAAAAAAAAAVLFANYQPVPVAVQPPAEVAVETPVAPDEPGDRPQAPVGSGQATGAAVTQPGPVAHRGDAGTSKDTTPTADGKPGADRGWGQDQGPPEQPSEAIAGGGRGQGANGDAVATPGSRLSGTLPSATPIPGVVSGTGVAGYEEERYQSLPAGSLEETTYRLNLAVPDLVAARSEVKKVVDANNGDIVSEETELSEVGAKTLTVTIQVPKDMARKTQLALQGLGQPRGNPLPQSRDLTEQYNQKRETQARLLESVKQLEQELAQPGLTEAERQPKEVQRDAYIEQIKNLVGEIQVLWDRAGVSQITLVLEESHPAGDQ